jgi:hypothetical protein
MYYTVHESIIFIVSYSNSSLYIKERERVSCSSSLCSALQCGKMLHFAARWYAVQYTTLSQNHCTGNVTNLLDLLYASSTAILRINVKYMCVLMNKQVYEERLEDIGVLVKARNFLVFQVHLHYHQFYCT